MARDEDVQVVCVGAATFDAISAVDRYPEADERVEAADFVVAGGGLAATAAVTLARLGVAVAFVGAVADDLAGRMLRDDLQREGVDVEDLELRPGGRTRASTIIVDTRAGTRAIAAFPGSVGAPRLTPRALGRCRRAAWVHADHAGYAAVEPLRGLARPSISIDAGNPISGLSLAGIGLYAPTEAALHARYPDLHLDDAMQAALDDGAACVVVTRGARGSVAATREGRAEAPPYPVRVYSTLGAGDVFHGALLCQLLEARPLAEALYRANVAAALSCRALDGRSAIANAEELEQAVSRLPRRDSP